MAVETPAVVASVVFPDDEREVKAADEVTAPPMVVPLILPPLIVTLLAESVLAVTSPSILTVSNPEPIFIVSAVVLSVPMLILFPPLPPILIAFELVPVPMFTSPVVAESKVKDPLPEEVTVPDPVKLKVFPPTLKLLTTPITEPNIGFNSKLTC